jgi:hypothetical protein
LNWIFLKKILQLIFAAGKPGSSTPSLVGHRKSDDWSRADSDISEPNEQITSIGLHHFVGEFSSKLTENHVLILS